MSNTDTQGGSKPEAMKDAASQVASEAKDAGQQVSSTVGQEARRLTHDVKSEARTLFSQASEEVSAQAGTQQKRVAGGLRSVGDELHSMADGSTQGGFAPGLVSEVASRVDTVAEWLDSRDPAAVLDDVKSFARSRPGLFIALAAGAGLLAGRAVKAFKDADGSTVTHEPTTQGTTGAAADAGLSPAMAETGGSVAPIYEETVRSTGGGIQP
jgi:hypothetical protein